MYGESESTIRTWAMFCHLAAFSGFIGVPLGHIVGPLIVWLIARDKSSFIDDQGKESLNFQFSVIIYSAAFSAISVLVALLTCGFGFIALVPAISVFVIAEFVLVIMAAVRAQAGEYYRYPYTIRFLN